MEFWKVFDMYNQEFHMFASFGRKPFSQLLSAISWWLCFSNQLLPTDMSVLKSKVLIYWSECKCFIWYKWDISEKCKCYEISTYYIETILHLLEESNNNLRDWSDLSLRITYEISCVFTCWNMTHQDTFWFSCKNTKDGIQMCIKMIYHASEESREKKLNQVLMILFRLIVIKFLCFL